LIYSDLSTWPAFSGEKAPAVLQPGSFFLRIFQKNKKTINIYSVYIALYYKNRRIDFGQNVY